MAKDVSRRIFVVQVLIKNEHNVLFSYLTSHRGQLPLDRSLVDCQTAMLGRQGLDLRPDKSPLQPMVSTLLINIHLPKLCSPKTMLLHPLHLLHLLHPPSLMNS